jgi:hypothetical protein
MDLFPAPSTDLATSASNKGPRYWATPLRLLLIVLWLGASIMVLQRNDAAGVDYVQFWHIGRTVVHGPKADPYSESGGKEVARELGALGRQRNDEHLREATARRATLVPTATPLLYAVFGAFSSASYSESVRAYRIAQIACFSIAVFGFGALLGLGPELSLIALILLLSESQAIASDLRVGNVNALQLIGLWLYAWLRLRAPFRQREAFSALWFGALIAFKPNLLLVGCVLLLQPLLLRSWIHAARDALSMVLGALFAMLFAGAIWGDLGAWLHWFQAGRRILGGVATVKQGNFAVVALFPDASPGWVSWILLSVVVAVAGVGMYFRSSKNEGPAARWSDSQALWYLSLGCLSSLLVTHLAWVHYFLLAVPALLFLTARWKPSSDKPLPLGRTIVVLSAWLLFAMVPLRSLDLPTVVEGRCMIVNVLLLLGALFAEPEAPRVGVAARRIRGGS